LGLAVVLKTTLDNHNGSQDVAAPVVATNASNEVAAGANDTATPPGPGAAVRTVAADQSKPPVTQEPPVTQVVATTPDQDRQAAIQKELDKINDALLDGGADPKLVEGVREQLLNPEPEVRKAATETVRQLDDRGAIPKLQEALQNVEDVREKAAILDAIEYLQTPEGIPQLTTDMPPSGQPPSITNRPVPPLQPRAGKN
jgi:hypothetical protein